MTSRVGAKETGTVDTVNKRRRQFLGASLLAMGAYHLPQTAFATEFWDAPRTLWLVRQSTQEEVRALYWIDGHIHLPGYIQVCNILRDVQANIAVQMDLAFLDILRGIQGWFEAFNLPRPIIINSGYRTLNTNNHTEGAKKQSKHMEGKAGDIWIPNTPTDYLARLGLYLRGGGVGFYPGKNFIHVDSGNLRVWRG